MMGVEMLSLILAATAGVLVLLIIGANVYFRIRRKFPKRVTCWFCQESTKVPYDEQNCWECPSCEQYNGFSADGGYNQPIPAQYTESLNNVVSLREPPKEEQVPADNGLCFHCNTNQQLKIQQLASFSPTNPSRYNDEVAEFHKRLEQYYRLCDSCEAVLKKKLKHQASWILGLQLNNLRKKTLRQKDDFLNKLGRLQVTTTLCFRYLNAVLAAWLVLSVAAYIIDPSLSHVPLTPWIRAVLSYVVPDLPKHVTLPDALAGLIKKTLTCEIFLTAVGLVIQSGVGSYERQIPRRSQWKRVDVLSCLLWAVSHLLCWGMLWGGTSSWSSKGTLKAVHGSVVFSVLLGTLASTFKSVQCSSKPGKIVIGKKLLSKQPSDGLEFSDNEELETTLLSPSDSVSAPKKQPSTFSSHILSTPAANGSKSSSLPRFNSVFKNMNCANSTNTISEATSNSITSNVFHADVDTTSQLDYNISDNCANGFKNLRRRHDTSSVSDKSGNSKTKSRFVKCTRSSTRKTPNDISELLNSSVGNISLPVETPAKDMYNQLPLEIDNGLSNLKLGSPLKDVRSRHRSGSDDGYMELFKGCNSVSSCRRRPVIGPSHFQPRTNVARSSWVAGGFWQAPRLADSPNGTDVNTPLSRSSSQSSGFVSQSSQLPNSRSSSICGADCDAQSVTSERCSSGFYHSSPTLDSKSHSPNPLHSRSSLIYNMSGGLNYPRGISSDVGLDSSFSSNKNLVYPENEHPSYVFHGDRTIRYPTSLFSPQPFYFQQSFPTQYLSTYGPRFCYPQQFAMPPLWNPGAFALPQQQLCISAPLGDTSRSSSRCSETNESFEVKPPTGSRFNLLKLSLTNVLIVVTLVCSLFYNAVYSGLLSLPNPG